jgi:hypothetical protein
MPPASWMLIQTFEPAVDQWRFGDFKLLPLCSEAGTPQRGFDCPNDCWIAKLDGRHIDRGLAIAKGIMDAHGDSIDAESPASNDRGAQFTLTFPRGGTAP